MHNFECKCEDCIAFLKKKYISTYGSEYEFIMQPIIHLQQYNLTLFCSTDCELNRKTVNLVSMNFEKINNLTSLVYTKSKNCGLCNGILIHECIFLQNPPWIIVQKINRNAIYVDELPKVLSIHNSNYKFLCASIYTNSFYIIQKHFRSIFYLNSAFVLVDDLKKKN